MPTQYHGRPIVARLGRRKYYYMVKVWDPTTDRYDIDIYQRTKHLRSMNDRIGSPDEFSPVSFDSCNADKIQYLQL